MNNEEHFYRSGGPSYRNSQRGSPRYLRRSSPPLSLPPLSSPPLSSPKRGLQRGLQRGEPRRSFNNRVQQVQTSTTHTLGGTGGGPFWGWGFGYPWVYFNNNPWEGEYYTYNSIPKILYSYNVFDQDELIVDTKIDNKVDTKINRK